jgi:hypothetical protein
VALVVSSHRSRLRGVKAHPESVIEIGLPNKARTTPDLGEEMMGQITAVLLNVGDIDVAGRSTVDVDDHECSR